jgi:hypothetical protein
VAARDGNHANGMPRNLGCPLKHPQEMRASEHNMVLGSLTEIEEAGYGALANE